MNETNVVMIHGTHGNPQENWLPWLTRALRERGCAVTVPTFPTPERQNPAEWMKVFVREVGELKESTVLVGHSLGVAFILRLLEEAAKPIRGTFLVSGFLGALEQPEFDVVNAPFFEKGFDWEKIRAHAGQVFAYNGDNDPYVPLAKGEELARNLGIELTVIKNGGHLNESAGFSTFPKLLKDMDSVIGEGA